VSDTHEGVSDSTQLARTAERDRKRFGVGAGGGNEAAEVSAGWDEERVRRVLEYYETRSEEEAVIEDGAAYEAVTHTAMEVPVGLVPVVRELIATQRAG
jgi:hypothetical protein